MQPTTPSFHDARTHEELQNALAAAESAVTLADAERRRIEAALTYSRSELQRAQALARNNAISRMALDKASFDVDTNEAALASAKAALDVRRSERGVAARLRNPSGSAANASIPRAYPICPVSCRVLRLIQESESVVPALRR
jgi:HlyD family secretion protein